jgi:20S proteasome alpha/beta subunit
LSELQILTVNIGAKCSDGIALIADRKYTNIILGKKNFDSKVFGDIAHFLTLFTGQYKAFDIFRKYVVGDMMINQNDNDIAKHYTFNNIIPKFADLVKKFNESIDKLGPKFELLTALHQYKQSGLYYINTKGESEKVTDYKAIGNGGKTADIFCETLQHNEITMKDFIKQAYLAIMFMDKYCPGLGVGVEADGIPNIKYLYYNKEWDLEPTPQDIEWYKEYVHDRLGQIRETFERTKY